MSGDRLDLIVGDNGVGDNGVGDACVGDVGDEGVGISTVFDF